MKCSTAIVSSTRRTPTPARVALTGSAAAALLMAAAAVPAHADDYVSEAFGHHLHGALVQIFWGGADGGLSPPVPIIGDPVTETGTVVIPAPAGGFARFSLSGDSFEDPWIITNLSQNHIIWINFDLRPSVSVFDIDPNAFLSPGSFLGRPVTYVAGDSTAPMHLESQYMTPDPSGKNAGEMFLQNRIFWGTSPTHPNAFLGGQTFTYLHDTDLIPAPGVLALLAASGLLASRRRRGIC